MITEVIPTLTVMHYN